MKIGKYSYKFNNVYLDQSSTVCGLIEKEGPLSNLFDYKLDDNYFGEKSWEKAEMKILKKSIDLTLSKTKITNFDLAISGDLINQNIISNYVYRNYDLPFIGIFGACSNITLGLFIGSNLLETKNMNNILISTSSHNSTSERQFRYPVEYGGARPESATFTVTGAGSCIITNQKRDIKITQATLGKIIDVGTKDPYNMGAAMAPAAVETYINHLSDNKIDPNYYDLVLTGDLSNEGSKVFKESIETYYNTKINNYNDCGLIIYDINNQNVFSGGSGCACSALVLFTYVRDLLLNNKIKNCLLIATGALMNPLILNQKETIPSTATAILFERGDLDDIS